MAPTKKYIVVVDDRSKELQDVLSTLSTLLYPLGMSDIAVVGYTGLFSFERFQQKNSANVVAYFIEEHFPSAIGLGLPQLERMASLIFDLRESNNPDAVVVLHTDDPAAPVRYKLDPKIDLVLTKDTSIESYTKVLEFIKSRISKGMIQDQELAPNDPLLHSIEILSPPWEEIRRYLARHPHFMEQMSPQQFEELAAEIFRSHGFEVELTAQTRDGGFDIIAIKHNSPTNQRILVEAKRHRPDKPLNPRLVESIYGLKSVFRATQVCLVTSAYVGKPTKKKLIEREIIPWELDLYERNRIIEWCKTAGAVELGGDLDGNIEPSK